MTTKKNARRAADFGEYQHDGHNEAASQMRLPLSDSIIDGTPAAFDQEAAELEETRRLVKEARELVAAYPSAWQAMRDYVWCRIYEGKSVSRSGVLAAALAKDHVNIFTGATLRGISHCIGACLMRWLFKEVSSRYPDQARALFKFRGSRFDDLPTLGTAYDA